MRAPDARFEMLAIELGKRDLRFPSVPSHDSSHEEEVPRGLYRLIYEADELVRRCALHTTRGVLHNFPVLGGDLLPHVAFVQAHAPVRYSRHQHRDPARTHDQPWEEMAEHQSGDFAGRAGNEISGPEVPTIHKGLEGPRRPEINKPTNVR